MSHTRRVSIPVVVDVTKDRSLDVILPPILPRERMLTLLAEALERDGWQRDGTTLLQEEKTVSRRFDVTVGEVTVEISDSVCEVVEVEDDDDDQASTATEDVGRARAEVRVARKVAAKVDAEVERLRARFRERYVPATLAEAVAERARTLDPTARVTRSEDDSQMVVTIELEAEA